MKYRLIFTFIILLFSSLGYSQNKYSVELESFNDKHPRKVLEEFSEYIDDNKRNLDNGVFYFESEVLYTEENFNEIAAATGYKIKKFKVIAKNGDNLNLEE